jgi:hypothetical protein
VIREDEDTTTPPSEADAREGKSSTNLARSWKTPKSEREVTEEKVL